MSYVDKYGVEFSDDKKTLECCPLDFAGEYYIPDGVTKIACGAFYKWEEDECVGDVFLVQLPYYRAAFYGCTGLTSIEIPNSVTEIGTGAFCDCTGLTSVKIPNGVTGIGVRTFANCTVMASIEIPNSVTEIGTSAFSGCTGLTSIKIPNSVTEIGSSAFSGCTGLTSIKIPNSVTDIQHNAFSGCTGLTSIEIPNSVIYISFNAFEGCTGLTSIEIPNSVTYIGSDAFNGCTGLTSIEIPNSVTDMGDDFPYDIPLEESVFKGCINIQSLIIKYVSGCEELDINYLDYLNRKIVKYVTISDGIKSIPDGMFEDMNSLEMVHLSNTLTALPNKTFHNCKSVEELNIPDSVKFIGDDCIVGCGLLKTLVIPEGVEKLGNRAICDCDGLESVTLPSTVKRIGSGFLCGCPNLKQVIIPSGSKLKFLQLGLDNIKDKLVERGTGAHAGNFAPQGDVDELNMLFTLGKAYELGIGVGKNILQAIMMYTQAAGKGHAAAAYRIAEMYRKGEGLPQNMESAIQYYRIAANSNFMDSASIVRDYEERLRKEEQKPLQPYYLFFDTETTGLPARYDAPCSDTNNWPRLVQLSWIVTDIDGNVIRTSDNIIKPVGFTIPFEASNLHGITTNKALSEGKDLRSVIEQFMGEINNVSYVVGHNVEFDTNIVGAELYRLGISGSDLLYKQSICTMKSTIDYCQIPPYRYGSYKFPKLQELHKKLFGYEFDDAHNSMCDVEATKKCFFELVKRRII